MGGPIVGIDLGTTNSLVAFCDAGGPRILESEGRGVVPSVVRYEPDDAGGWRTIVGGVASEGAIEHPLHTVSSAKRLMGRSLADASEDLAYLGYRVVEGENGQARIAIPEQAEGKGGTGGQAASGAGRLVTPQEVSAEILRELRRIARDALGEDISRAVVTVPAYFDDAQRQATRDAGRLAGLEVVRVVNEPTAAALAYGLGLDPARGPRTVAVYDFGGGTFDVSILKIVPGEGPGEPAIYQVLSTAGDTHLGGDDIDHEIVRLFAHEISETRVREGLGAVELMDLAPQTRRALVGFARLVKHRLSEEWTARVEIVVDEHLRYEREISREELESIMAPIVERTLRACERARRDAERKGATEIDAAVLVGGSTRIPLVRRRVGEAFGVEAYTALDPDEVVALGAGVQGSILAGVGEDARASLLLDVIPLSLGIETVGGAVAKLITRNSAVPARATEMFSTSVDGQGQIKLHVVQGEREMVSDCRSLGVFILKVPPMPAGVPQIEVEFLVDANGVLNVSAIERRSQRRAQLQVIPNHGLTRDEVERIESESLEHASEDMARHRVVDLIANSGLDCKWVSERLERFADELDPAYASELRVKLDALIGLVAAAERDWRSVDPDLFYRTKQELDELSVRLQEIAISSTLRDGQG